MSLLRLSRNEFRQQPVHPVHALDPGPAQLGPPVDQQPQRLELHVVGQHPKRRGAHRDHRDGVRVVRVGLAVVPGVQRPGPGRELRRDVDDVLAVGQQPLRQRPAGTVAALHRPRPLGVAGDVFAHRRVPGLVRGEPAGRQDRLLVVDDLDGRRQLVGIDPDEHPRHDLPCLPPSLSMDAGRALLLRAGQTPLEPHTGTVTGGNANRR